MGGTRAPPAPPSKGQAPPPGWGFMWEVWVALKVLRVMADDNKILPTVVLSSGRSEGAVLSPGGRLARSGDISGSSRFEAGLLLASSRQGF